jgi:hypothetical protein
VSDPHGWNQQRANIIQQRDRAAAEQHKHEHGPLQNQSQGGTFGAISYDVMSNRYGWSWGCASQEVALQRARQESGGYNPDTFWANNWYIALATNNFGTPGMAGASRRRKAEKLALAEWPGRGEPYKLVMTLHASTGQVWRH